MRLRRLAETVSALALCLPLLASPSRAETPVDLALPLPEQPALVLDGLTDVAIPSTATADAAPQTAPSQEIASQEAARPDEAEELVTGTLSAGQPKDEPRWDLGLPVPELPPVDPALAARPAMPEIVLPPLPEFAVTIPQGLELSGLIASRAETALALPRLAPRERADIAAAYAAHDNRPFWIEDGRWSAPARQLIARFEHAAEDGLRADDYAVPVISAGNRDSLAEADLRLSALAVLYARDARGGRIDPRRLSRMLTPTLALPSATEVLSEITGAADPGAVLAAYNPPHEGYRRLKAKLAELRADRPETPMVRIPAGPALRVGMQDARVPLIRARLGLGPSEEQVFDRSTATALAEFQRKAGLSADGVLGDQTLRALATSRSARLEGDIVAQMERWRWLPADLGESHITVNIPEYRMRMVRDGRLAHEARVIVGKAASATPIFSHRMDHVVVNPSWYIPPSIMKNEILPGLARDPDYAAKRGYVVTRRGNTVSVRQPPGERNALGWIKFMFPNDHAVYLHDTPNRRLFAAEQRAFSHGCVRVEDPFALADMVLGPEWSKERLKKLIGSGERTIRLPKPMPIHLVYETHVVDEAGTLRTFGDIYGFHRLVRAALERG
ncbi:L,D-transpeptidase family protein [Bosea sp. TWI1241]|uniref:L,D-transpeptidase family protein n=1 Tax=Bosea sp. TWI1241 TaxID=3148904 RepID=UPI0032096277